MVGVALALAVTGCGQSGSAGGSRDCTLIGCSDQVTVMVDQPGGRPLQACVGTVCSPPGDVLVVDGVTLGDTVDVVVRVDRGGVEVARATATPSRVRPNGADCPPECRSARLRLTLDDQLVPA